MPEANFRKLRAVEAFLMGAGTAWCIMPMATQAARFTISCHSDTEAIASDWSAVGADMAAAMQHGPALIHEEAR
jgi:hypothetical protein